MELVEQELHDINNHFWSEVYVCNMSNTFILHCITVITTPTKGLGTKQAYK